MKQYKREEIESVVAEIVGNFTYAPTDDVQMDKLLRDDLGLDSLDCVEIVINLEKEFGINIPDNEVDAAAGWTVSELCDYVEERLEERKK